MKKLLKSLLFVFLFSLLILTGNVEANSFNSINMDIYIDKNGNAHVTEIWDYTADSGTENYHSYKNIGNSEFTNFTVKEGNTIYTTIPFWNVNSSFNDKAYKCGINYLSDGVELCFGISSYGRHTYSLSYTITNFVSNLTDSQMAYWELVPSGSVKKDVYIKIYSDFDYSNDLPVWGYGNYGGTCYVYDGYIEMQPDGKLDSDEYMTILIKFPLDTFNTSNTLDEDFDYYYNMAEENATNYSDNSPDTMVIIIAILFVIFFTIIISICLATSVTNKSNKISFGSAGNKVPKDVPLYRDIPCKGDIFRAYFIAYNYNLMKKKTDLLGAILLKWLKENKVKVQKTEVGKIIKKEDTCIILENTLDFENKFEEELFNMFYESSKDGILEKKEFEKWCSKNYSKILNWFDNVLNYERDLLVEEGKITVQETTTLKIFKSKKYIADDSLMEEAKELKGLKNFLEEFTLIKEREAIEVALFEDYLIFAQILGISKKVATQFKQLYPEIIESYDYDFDDILLIYTFSTVGISSANSAKARAESYSSGGRRIFIWWTDGGGSFGGGGRNGFSLIEQGTE